MDLRDYLTKLQGLRQIAWVAPRVCCELELAALCRREFAKPDGGKALYFKQLEESQLPVVANLFGSERRVSKMLRSCSLVEFSEKVKNMLQRRKGTSAQRLNPIPRQSGITDCSQNRLHAVPPDLRSLPAIRSWPGETGRYLTLGLTVTQHPLSGERNVGLYRAQLLGSDQIALNFAPSSGAAQHLQIAAARNETLPVAIFLGSDPALLWTAAAPLPESCDEFSFCADLFKSSFSLTECLSNDLQVPADAELVIEGQITPGQTCVEGPFGNHTGSYVSRKDCPLLKVFTIRQKSQPIIPMTVVGPPPSENLYLAKANLVLIREMLKIDYPEIIDLQMPLETIFHAASLLTVRAQSQNANRELIDSLWRSSPLHRAKVMILLDEEIDLHSFSQCWWRTVNNLASDKIYQDSGRVAIDATGVDPASLVVENQQTIDLINQRSNEYKL